MGSLFFITNSSVYSRQPFQSSGVTSVTCNCLKFAFLKYWRLDIFSFLLTICFLSVNFKSLVHFSFILLVFSYIFRSLYMCITDTICYTDCIILCSPFFYSFRGIFVNYLIWKQTQFISDPAFNLFCTFIREKSLKTHIWPRPFLYDLWAFSPHPHGEARPLGKWLPCPSGCTALQLCPSSLLDGRRVSLFLAKLSVTPTLL